VNGRFIFIFFERPNILLKEVTKNACMAFYFEKVFFLIFFLKGRHSTKGGD
jgi:hypothetical protein